MLKKELIELRLTASVVLNGLIHTADQKVRVVESVAKDLLQRGKAVIAEELQAVRAATAKRPKG